MKNFLKKMWWFITDRCCFCGGDTWDWDSRHTYCNKCKKRQ